MGFGVWTPKQHGCGCDVMMGPVSTRGRRSQWQARFLVGLESCSKADSPQSNRLCLPVSILNTFRCPGIPCSSDLQCISFSFLQLSQPPRGLEPVLFQLLLIAWPSSTTMPINKLCHAAAVIVHVYLRRSMRGPAVRWHSVSQGLIGG